MKKVDWEFSSGDIPIPQRGEFQINTAGQLKILTSKICWHADRKLHPEKYENEQSKVTYGFKSSKKPQLSQKWNLL